MLTYRRAGGHNGKRRPRREPGGKARGSKSREKMRRELAVECVWREKCVES